MPYSIVGPCVWRCIEHVEKGVNGVMAPQRSGHVRVVNPHSDHVALHIIVKRFCNIAKNTSQFLSQKPSEILQ